MGEFQEFAEALFGQLAVEIDEEKEIIELASKARDDIAGKVEFKKLDDIANEVIPEFRDKIEEFLGIKVPDNIQLKFPELEELKRIKGKKVFSDEESKEFVTELFNAVGELFVTLMSTYHFLDNSPALITEESKLELIN